MASVTQVQVLTGPDSGRRARVSAEAASLPHEVEAATPTQTGSCRRGRRSGRWD